ncbi:MAG: metallophosphoesterase, partial [Gemmataceae bacterium]
DYATFLKLVKPLRDAGMPLHATLGNHDDRTNFLKAVPEVSKAEKPVADKVVGVVKAERARFVLLDSLAIVDKVPGEYGPAQLKWLAKTLDAEPTVPTIIVGHHNPTETGSPSLTDTLAFLDVVAPRKQVKAYIFGHTHAWKVSQHKTGIHFVNLPAVAYPFAKGQAIGWTVLTLKPDGAKLELRAADKHALNGQVHELTWRS